MNLANPRDEFYLEGMVALAMSRTPGILDHAPRKMKRRVLVNREIYAMLMERLRATNSNTTEGMK